MSASSTIAGEPAPEPEEPGASVLERSLREPGYTPPRRALPDLVRALGAVPEADVPPLERAIARAGAPALDAALAALEGGSAPEPALLRLLERLLEPGGDARALSPLLAALAGDSAECRKLAARALGKLRDARAEAPLIDLLRRTPSREWKSIVDALGALGGPAALASLPAAPLPADVGADADLARRIERARLLIERRLMRSEPARIELDRPLPSAWRVELRARSGLSEVLADELRESGFRPSVMATDRVEIQHQGTLGDLLCARTALDVALVVAIDPESTAPPAERIADALTRPETLTALAAWARGTPRFRVAWTLPGHRRALSWALARAVRRCTSALVNDASAAPWTVRARPDGAGELRLVPRVDPDPRFAHRVVAVRAASHPTIAAALARIARPRPGDVVWDPFAGSGLELCEVARLGPVRELWGSDVDEAALEAARTNLAAAGIAGARLVQGDALSLSPADVSVIVTNPPMGRRLARDGSLSRLLRDFVGHAARVLRPGGRLVWLSPLPRVTERAAREAALTATLGPDVDMGGFSAQLQVLARR